MKFPFSKKLSNSSIVEQDHPFSSLAYENPHLEFKPEFRIRKTSSDLLKKDYERNFSLTDCWIILKGGKCIFEYHKDGEDSLKLNTILFGGFIYAIHSFAYQLIDQGLDKIKIHENEFKFVDFGDILVLSMVEEGLNELIVKAFLYKIGERFIKLYFNEINSLRQNWIEIKDSFTKEIDDIVSDRKIRYEIVITSIKELCVKVYSSNDDLMLFYWHAIKLLRPFEPKELLLLYDEIRNFIDDIVKVDPIDTMQTLKNGFSQIVFHFINKNSGSTVDLNDINAFEFNDRSEIELITSLLNYDC